MWRYYLIATVIVVAIGTVVFAHRLAALHDFDVRSRPNPSMTPTLTRGSSVQVTPAATFSGEGPWVLSALPGCFDQKSSIEGPSLQLTHHVPPDAQRIRTGTTLRRGNCTVVVGEHDVWVFRGADRLRVPPEARLYDTPEGLTLVYEHDGRTEVRVY
jgi:hypothetical protein